jgi:phosphopantetheine adenylyltransferase
MEDITKDQIVEVTSNVYKIYNLLKDIKDPIIRLHIVNCVFVTEVANNYGKNYLEDNMDMIVKSVARDLMDSAGFIELARTQKGN